MAVTLTFGDQKVEELVASAQRMASKISVK
jgi:hypothetical protein